MFNAPVLLKGMSAGDGGTQRDTTIRLAIGAQLRSPRSSISLAMRTDARSCAGPVGLVPALQSNDNRPWCIASNGFHMLPRQPACRRLACEEQRASME